MRILWPQPNRIAECLRILHCTKQHRCIKHRHIRLRKTDTAGIGQLGHFGQRHAFQTDRQCAQWIHMRLIQCLCTMLQHLHQARLIQHRVRIRWTHEACDAALYCCLQLRLQCRLVFITRLAQPRTQVNQPRQNQQPACIDRPVCSKSIRRGTNRCDLAISDK